MMTGGYEDMENDCYLGAMCWCSGCGMTYWLSMQHDISFRVRILSFKIHDKGCQNVVVVGYCKAN